MLASLVSQAFFYYENLLKWSDSILGDRVKSSYELTERREKKQKPMMKKQKKDKAKQMLKSLNINFIINIIINYLLL